MCHWIVLYTVHFTAFCLGGPFFPGHGVYTEKPNRYHDIWRNWNRYRRRYLEYWNIPNTDNQIPNSFRYSVFSISMSCELYSILVLWYTHLNDFSRDFLQCLGYIDWSWIDVGFWSRCRFFGIFIGVFSRRFGIPQVVSISTYRDIGSGYRYFYRATSLYPKPPAVGAWSKIQQESRCRALPTPPLVHLKFRDDLLGADGRLLISNALLVK